MSHSGISATPKRLGWTWRSRKAKASMVFSTRSGAREDAVRTAMAHDNRSATFIRMSGEERFLAWKSLEKAGWELCEVGARLP